MTVDVLEIMIGVGLATGLYASVRVIVCEWSRGRAASRIAAVVDRAGAESIMRTHYSIALFFEAGVTAAELHQQLDVALRLPRYDGILKPEPTPPRRQEHLRRLDVPPDN